MVRNSFIKKQAGARAAQVSAQWSHKEKSKASKKGFETQQHHVQEGKQSA